MYSTITHCLQVQLYAYPEFVSTCCDMTICNQIATQTVALRHYETLNCCSETLTVTGNMTRNQLLISQLQNTNFVTFCNHLWCFGSVEVTTHEHPYQSLAQECLLELLARLRSWRPSHFLCWSPWLFEGQRLPSSAFT